jgi:acetyl esterase
LAARIEPGAWIAAYVLQRLSPLFWRPRKELYFGTHRIAKPDEVCVPTRHGAVRCLIYRPPGGSPPPPVHVLIHGGGMFGRYPEQDDHVATYLASEVGAVVVSVDYDVTPQVQFPVAEEECYDVALWIRANAATGGWDADRISVGGESAGGKLAINVCQLAYAGGVFRPCALVAAYAVADVTRADRTTGKRGEKISPALQRLVNDTYFADASRRLEALASPLFDPHLALALPATLIMTGEDDTLAPEMDRLAQMLGAAGVSVLHRRFAHTDHGFTHHPPVETAREAIALTGAHLAAAYGR